MADFVRMIADCEADLNVLHKNLHETAKHRGESPHQKEQWKRAAKAFRTFHSPVFDLVEQCLKNGLESDPKLREFTFDYIDQDPYFYRSGYRMESLLKCVKKLTLSDSEKASIQCLILSRIETRALRNFRQICRLIHMVENEGFHAQVTARTKLSDPQVKRRAAFALAYFPIDGRVRGSGFILK